MKVEPKDDIYKLIRGSELEDFTEAGWQLVQTLIRDEVVIQTEDVLTKPSENSRSGPSVVRLDRAIKIRVFYFVVRKSAESVLAAMKQRVQEAEGTAATHRANLEAAAKKLGEETSKAADLAVRLEKEKATVLALNNQVGVANHLRATTDALLVKLQGDFAKVWIAEGETKMKAILGATAENPNPPNEAARRTAFERINAEVQEIDDA